MRFSCSNLSFANRALRSLRNTRRSADDLGGGGKLQQVFTNLILNARDAMFENGTIRLRTFAGNDDGVVIEVIDNGQGIPTENLKKVFDPFFTTKGVGNGTGLGLAVPTHRSGTQRNDRSFQC
ncbi:MAG: ATP-binding protein [Acidobacteria bacterium]|nr:ATP-binding protein [Acidobacteriota bacterium]